MKTLHWMMVTGFVLFICNASFSKNYHTVKRGETLWSISRKYNVPFNKLKQANYSKVKDSLFEGTKLFIPDVESHGKKDSTGNQYTAKSGETVWSIARKFSISPYSLLKINNFPKNYLIKEGETIIIPKSNNSIKKAAISLPGSSENNNLRHSLEQPVQGRITSKYGLNENKVFNSGVEIQSHDNTIKSSEDGKVIFAGYIRGYGQTLIIEHDNNVCTIYSSKDMRIKKQVGQRVKQGEVIAINIKRKNFNIYFQVWMNNRLRNPEYYLNDPKERNYEFRSTNT